MKLVLIVAMILMVLIPGFRLALAVDYGGRRAIVRVANYRPRKYFAELEVNYGRML